MDKRIAQLEEAKQRFDRNNQIAIPKIQRISKFLRQNERFVKYCTPKIISFGPIHHNNDNVKQSEHYKLLWTSRFVEEYGRKTNEDANRACQILFKKIEDKIEEIKNMFTEDAIENYNGSELAWKLFVDGCSLIHFMENFDKQCPEALNLKFDQLIHMSRDVILLENQLPRNMLEILCEENGLILQDCFSNFLNYGAKKRVGGIIEDGNPNSFHILDYLRSIFLLPLTNNVSDLEEDNQMEAQINEEIKSRRNTYRTICDLKRVGIRVVKNETDERMWRNVSFISKWFSGELRLPRFLFNDNTPYVFRNLIAYEMCPDFNHNYECCSFITFMGTLVSTAEDVKELRLAGVFQNLLQSDKQLAKFLHELGHDLPTKVSSNYHSKAVAYSKKYILIKLQIEKHYTNKWRTWLAQAYIAHFDSPWAMTALFAALLVLVLTFVQTLFTILNN